MPVYMAIKVKIPNFTLQNPAKRIYLLFKEFLRVISLSIATSSRLSVYLFVYLSLILSLPLLASLSLSLPLGITSFHSILPLL